MIIKFFFIFLFLLNISYSEILKGIGMEMDNNSSIVYFMTNYLINEQSSIINDLGFNFRSINNNSIRLATGYSNKIYSDKIVGIFMPSLFIQAGYDINVINTILKKQYIYNCGIGVEFYNNQIINEFKLKLYNVLNKYKSASIKLSIYWK